METKEEEEYHGSEGPAKVRASGRVAQEACGPVQTTGRSPPGQDIDKPLKEPSTELQEGSSSSSTATRGDKEDEQRSIYPKDFKEDRSSKETPVIRTSRARGRVAGRLRGLVRTHGRAWRRRNTKTLGKATRRRGCYSREPREEAAGKAPPSQETEKPQEGSLNSSTAPKEGEEGEKPPTDRKNSIEERRGRVTHTTRAPRTGGGDGGSS